MKKIKLIKTKEAVFIQKGKINLYLLLEYLVF